jgi:hypothetical protein
MQTWVSLPPQFELGIDEIILARKDLPVNYLVGFPAQVGRYFGLVIS